MIDKERKLPSNIVRCINKRIRVYSFDLKHTELLKRVFKAHRIDVVFHLAANKYIDSCQENITKALQENVINTINVLSLSIESGVKKFVFTSSDKAVNPINNLGMSKMMAEKTILLLAEYANTFLNKTDVCIVRLCNVFASRGSILDVVKTKTTKKEKIRLFDKELERFFITMEEAADFLLFATSKKGIKILIPYPGQAINIYKLCQKTNEVIRQSNIELSEIKINKKLYKNYVKLREELVTCGEKYKKQKNYFEISF